MTDTKLTLWIAQDAAHTPVLLEMELPIGYGRIELVTRQRGEVAAKLALLRLLGSIERGNPIVGHENDSPELRGRLQELDADLDVLAFRGPR